MKLHRNYLILINHDSYLNPKYDFILISSRDQTTFNTHSFKVYLILISLNYQCFLRNFETTEVWNKNKILDYKESPELMNFASY